MVGLDAAGKTTILYLLKMGETVKTIPTIGFNVETFDYNSLVKLTVWDLGSQDLIRVICKDYYQNTDGLIFVVDSNDRDRVDDATGRIEKNVSRGRIKRLRSISYGKQTRSKRRHDTH